MDARVVPASLSPLSSGSRCWQRCCYMLGVHARSAKRRCLRLTARWPSWSSAHLRVVVFVASLLCSLFPSCFIFVLLLLLILFVFRLFWCLCCNVTHFLPFIRFVLCMCNCVFLAFSFSLPQFPFAVLIFRFFLPVSTLVLLLFCFSGCVLRSSF